MPPSKPTAARGVNGSIDAYAAAWHSTCPTATTRYVARACADGVTYADPWVRLRGVVALREHITEARRIWPLDSWQPIGDPWLLGRQALIRWIWSRNGVPLFEGLTIAQLEVDGRFAEIAVRLQRTLSAAEPGCAAAVRLMDRMRAT